MSFKYFVLSLTFSVSLSAFGQQVQTDKKEVNKEASLLILADNLVSYGHQTKTALPLIQAIQIFRQLNVVDDAENAGQTFSPFSEVQLLADATKYAEGDKSLLAIIKDTEKATRSGFGPLSGATRIFGTVRANSHTQKQFRVENGQHVKIVLDGQGEGISRRTENDDILTSDLRLTVYDNNLKIVATDNSVGENCFVSFISKTSGVYYIEIKNVGQLSDDYILYIYRH